MNNINKLTNFIFNCCYFDMTSVLDKIMKDTDLSFQHIISSNISDIENQLALSTNSATLGNYVIITDNPSIYSGKFISNNIINIQNKTIERLASEIIWVLSGFKYLKKDNDDHIFVVSDTHFYHKNIIKYCNRPWMTGIDDKGIKCPTDDDVITMNQELITRWNNVVSENDIVYHLGDFGFGNKEKIKNCFNKLNGKIRLILGNHDKLKFKDYYEMGFDRVYDYPIIIQDFIVLSHAPRQWVQDPMFNIFGHVHDCAAYPNITKNSCCCCVERWQYAPISLSKIKSEYLKLD